jgi:hypothetical protein
MELEKETNQKKERQWQQEVDEFYEIQPDSSLDLDITNRKDFIQLQENQENIEKLDEKKSGISSIETKAKMWENCKQKPNQIQQRKFPTTQGSLSLDLYKMQST